MNLILLNLFISLTFQSSFTKSHQKYSPNTPFNCTDSSLYTCNTHQPSSCTSFLLFRSQPPYTAVTTIAGLFSSDPSQLASVNNVSKTTIFPLDKDIIVPVNCSCNSHHQFYQALTTYRIEPQSLTYFLAANVTFQGLSTCGSLKRANSYSEFRLKVRFKLNVPLLCSCPTHEQRMGGTKYLLTYGLRLGDTLNYVARRFNVTAKSLVSANQISESDTLYAFSTLLIPFSKRPSISDVMIEPYKPTTSSSSSPKLSRTNEKKWKKIVVVGVCSFCVFTVVAFIVLAVVYMKKKSEKMTENKVLPADLLVKIARFERSVKVYSFKELQKALNKNRQHFSLTPRVLPNVVYCGVFRDGIRSIKKTGNDASKQVNMLSKINHVNLTKLHGYCKHQDSWYLVFEYMNKGTLKQWLKETDHSLGTLRKRIEIAIDVANGLRYLHNFTKPGYVHNNLTTQNILLDGNLRAKISNFRLARSIHDRKDDKVAGTRGYMAPEYVSVKGLTTSKVDVYSFGVVLLEIITGKEAVVRYDGGEEELLSRVVMDVIMEGEDDDESEIVKGLIDLGDDEDGLMDCAVRVVRLGLKCLKQDPESRPNMDEIVSCLVKIQVDLRTVV